MSSFDTTVAARRMPAHCASCRRRSLFARIEKPLVWAIAFLFITPLAIASWKLLVFR